MITMKKNLYKYFILPFLSLVLTTACSDYLTPTLDSQKMPEDIFGNYSSFQAYTDQLYLFVCDPMGQLTSDACFGGEAIGSLGTTTGYSAIRGNYYGFTTRGFFQYSLGGSTGAGIWDLGWRAIRMANIGITNLPLLEKSSASDQEKARIKGQLYFFRAYCHFEILSAWGSIPYINEVLGDGELDRGRFYEYKGKKDYQACTEYVVQDLDSAIKYLPITWPNVNDIGHATKLAALGYKARALLYAGSPLMNEYSGNTAVVDKDYMKRAADAAGQLINIADTARFVGPCPYPVSIDPNQLACSLLPMSQYQQMFATTDGTSPWKQEVLWGKYRSIKGSGNFTNVLGRIQAPDKAIFGGNGTMQSVTQNFVDLFEMADGKVYDPALYDADNAKRWNFRDPRFRKSVYVDRDMAGLDPSTKLDLYTSGGTGATDVAGKGRTKAADNCLTPYIIHKFWPVGVNTKDGGLTGATLWNNFRFMVPLMRLAEIYLIYAEAVNEGYGSPTANATGCSLTAVDAVNKVRLRAYEGSVNPCPLATASAPAYAAQAAAGGPGAFTRLVINESNVETCFEGRYWYNLRRWKLGEALNQTSVYDLQFDKAWTSTSFKRVEVAKRIFESPKHYWLPFPTSQTQLYVDFPQNTGW
jgi:hypothetical protein